MADATPVVTPGAARESWRAAVLGAALAVVPPLLAYVWPWPALVAIAPLLTLAAVVVCARVAGPLAGVAGAVASGIALPWLAAPAGGVATVIVYVLVALALGWWCGVPARTEARETIAPFTPAVTDFRTEEFLGILGHELRNPLSPLRTALQLLRMPGVQGARAAELLDVADRQVTEMVHIIDSLSDYSRSRRGKIELYPEQLDMGALLGDAVTQTRTVRDHHEQVLHVDAATEPLPVRGDAMRLTQIVLHLLDNASRFTPDGGRIDVSLRRDGDQIEIRVRDNGIGIDGQAMGQIFEAFAHGRPAPGRSSGLGLGLTLARDLTAMHAGSLTAHSAGPGQGSEFRLRLPLAA